MHISWSIGVSNVQSGYIRRLHERNQRSTITPSIDRIHPIAVVGSAQRSTVAQRRRRLQSLIAAEENEHVLAGAVAAEFASFTNLRSAEKSSVASQ